MDSSEPKPKAKRSGSENRQATARLTLRLTPAQARQLDEAAEKSGLTPCSYARAKLFSGQPVRLTRRPPVERQALAQFLAWMGRLAGSVYQIARALNFGEGFNQRELNKALKEIAEMRNAVMAALGREVV